MRLEIIAQMDAFRRESMKRDDWWGQQFRNDEDRAAAVEEGYELGRLMAQTAMRSPGEEFEICPLRRTNLSPFYAGMRGGWTRAHLEAHGMGSHVRGFGIDVYADHDVISFQS